VGTATFILAVIGAISGCGALAWNVRTFYLSGPKVSVTLEAGWMGRSGVTVYPIGQTSIHARADEYPGEVRTVTACNTGRQPIAITAWKVTIGKATYTLPGGPHNPPR
jgi:hypothetical protein